MATHEAELLKNLNEFTAFARKRISDPQLAEDAVQDSLLKALSTSSKLRKDESVKAWFYRILRHTIIDLYRRRAVQNRGLAKIERELSELPTPEADRLVCGCLDRIVPTLKPEYSEAIRLLDLDGETYHDVAARLEISENNLKVRLHRARKQLRERLITTCGICATHGCLDCTCGAGQKRRH